MFLSTSQMRAPFKYYFSKEHLFWEKRGALIRGRRSLNISRQKGGANSREALSRAEALFRVNRVSNINNLLTMISMRVTWDHFYIRLVCQNWFAHSVLVLVALSMALSNFVKGPVVDPAEKSPGWTRLFIIITIIIIIIVLPSLFCYFYYYRHYYHQYYCYYFACTGLSTF